MFRLAVQVFASVFALSTVAVVLSWALVGCVEAYRGADDTEAPLPPQERPTDAWDGYQLHQGAAVVPVTGAYPLLLCLDGDTLWHAAPPLAWVMREGTLEVTCPEGADDLRVRWVD